MSYTEAESGSACVFKVIYIFSTAKKLYLMDLSEIVAVTGMPGLFKVTNKRADGLIVTSLLDDKTQFIPGRTHMFTTLDNITIYTTEDTTPLEGESAGLPSKKRTKLQPAVPDGKKDDELKSGWKRYCPLTIRKKCI